MLIMYMKQWINGRIIELHKGRINSKALGYPGAFIVLRSLI